MGYLTVGLIITIYTINFAWMVINLLIRLKQLLKRRKLKKELAKKQAVKLDIAMEKEQDVARMETNIST